MAARRLRRLVLTLFVRVARRAVVIAVLHGELTKGVINPAPSDRGLLTASLTAHDVISAAPYGRSNGNNSSVSCWRVSSHDS